MNATSLKATPTARRIPVLDEDWTAHHAQTAVAAPRPEPVAPAPGPTALPRRDPSTIPAPAVVRSDRTDTDRSGDSAAAANSALYTLEAPVHCPECESEIQTLRVVRVLRTQVSFTSTLPRKGYVILCPDCERILSAELSGLL